MAFVDSKSNDLCETTGRMRSFSAFACSQTNKNQRHPLKKLWTSKPPIPYNTQCQGSAYYFKHFAIVYACYKIVCHHCTNNYIIRE